MTRLTHRSVSLTSAAVIAVLAPAAPVGAQEQSITYEIVAHFNNPVRSGSDPAARLVQASDGQFYGTTRAGGQFGGHDLQQWQLEPAGGGGFRIIARHSGQALDVYGALVDDRTPIIQFPVHGGDNQVWILEPVSDGYVRLVARHSGKAMVASPR